MAGSIISDSKRCYRCGSIFNLHKHHIYGGPNRKISEQEGFYVYLCPMHHNWSDEGVHFNREFDLELKKECQQIYEKEHSREEFMALIGRNYL